MDVEECNDIDSYQTSKSDAIDKSFHEDVQLNISNVDDVANLMESNDDTMCQTNVLVKSDCNDSAHSSVK